MLAAIGGDEDVAVNQLDDELEKVEGSKTRKMRFLKMRMVASQAVASEFVVTGCFLMVSLSSYILNQVIISVYIIAKCLSSYIV